MKTLIILTITILCSCSAINNLEADHYRLHNHTKALKVIGYDNKNCILSSFSGYSVYFLKNKWYTPEVGDTVIIAANNSLVWDLNYSKIHNLTINEEGYFSWDNGKIFWGLSVKELKNNVKKNRPL